MNIPKRENISRYRSIGLDDMYVHIYTYAQPPTSLNNNDKKAIAKNKKYLFEIVIVSTVSRMLFKEARLTC